MMLDHEPLRQTLAALQPALAAAQRPWWILGSAAVLLHGADPGEVKDLDVLLDLADFAPVMAQLGLVPQQGSADDRFRSARFNQWRGGALPAELFADLTIWENGSWQPCRPATRVAVGYFGQQLYLPGQAELVAILRRFGRPKDLARAAALSAGGQFPSRPGSV